MTATPYWLIDGYPEKFSVAGVEFHLKHQTKWFRVFGSDSIEPYLKTITVSRLIDGSADLGEAIVKLQSMAKHTKEYNMIVTAIKLGGKQIAAKCPEHIQLILNEHQEWISPG